jgi:hypothetical protein
VVKNLGKFDIVVLPLAGFVTFLGLLLRGPLVLPSSNVTIFVEAASSSNFVLIWILLFLGTFLSIYGILALYGVISSQEKRWSKLALIFSIAGLLIFLPTTGIITFVGPYAAQLYIHGQTVAIQLLISSLNSPANLGFLIISGIIYTIGTFIFAISIWKSKTLPLVAGILFALHGPLVTFGAATTYLAEITGGIFFFVSGLWIAWSVLRNRK